MRNFQGDLGGPSLAGHAERDFSVLESAYTSIQLQRGGLLFNCHLNAARAAWICDCVSDEMTPAFNFNPKLTHRYGRRQRGYRACWNQWGNCRLPQRCGAR